MLVYASAAWRARRNAPLSTTEQFRRAMEVITPNGVPSRFEGPGAATMRDPGFDAPPFHDEKAVAASSVAAPGEPPAAEVAPPAAEGAPKPRPRSHVRARVRPAPRRRPRPAARRGPRTPRAPSRRARPAVRPAPRRRAPDARERALVGLCGAVPATVAIALVGGGEWWALAGVAAAALALYVTVLLEDKHRRDERRRKVRSLAARRAAHGRPAPAGLARASGRR